ncbi:KH domain-containing protein At4g18375-like isoform X2 [Tasmannia lanceolata]|uniref:KH domain-containing protein At4g18375-like isoform X2 n=1 Tax=Tasmannia lanceolata TaxID=3420 RepID=UPI004063EBA8
MGETGKRTRPVRDNDSDEKYQKRRFNNKDNSGDGELVVYRILCPDSVIGSVIGKSGKVINNIRQETRSKIKVVDPFPGANERVITVYCHVRNKDDTEVDEDDTKPICPAQDALLKVHAAITDAMANVGDSDKKRKEEAHILVPSSQVANVIGKSGSTIKKLRTKTKTYIKVTPKDPNDPTHSCAMDFDSFVLINGDMGAVKKALFAISAIMYKFSPKEEISLDTTVPDLPPSIIIPSDVPVYPTGGFYHSAEAKAPAPRSGPSVMGTTQHIPELHGYTDAPWPMYSSALPVVSGFGGSSPSEELKVRVLCPSDKIGRVIGKGGSSIKNVREATGARIEVDDTKDERDECVITVTSTESVDDLKSTAVEAVLLLQGKINDIDDDDDTVNMRLLVPHKVIGCLIGKSGSIVNDMRKRTKADIRISKGEKPRCANSDDELVEAIGKVGSVRDALVQIILRLRDYALKDKEGGHSAPAADSVYSSSFSVPSVLPSITSIGSLGYDQRVETGSGLGMLSSSSSLYGYGSFQAGENGYGSIHPYSSNPYGEAGENGYGSIHSYSSNPYGGLPSSLEVTIPSNAVGKVMGRGGANIANIRKISGATVEILDSKTSRSDRIAQISGTPEQKHMAENLIQAFIMST